MDPWQEAGREKERRQRELASLHERRLSDFARRLRSTRLDLSDVEQVPNEISIHDYRRDQENELDKELARALRAEAREGGYGE